MIWEVHGEIPRLMASIETQLFISTTGKIFFQIRKVLAGIIANAYHCMESFSSTLYRIVLASLL